MPPAARITDNHTCPKVDPPPHVGGPVKTGCSTVHIGYQWAARVGDKAICVPGLDTISKGEPTVHIGNQHAARIGDPTEHGGKIVQGCRTVLIGSQTFCMAAAAANATPFVRSGD